MTLSQRYNMRFRVGLIMLVGIAAIHAFRLGSYLEGDLFVAYYSYASDVIVPFGIYFLLCMNDFHIIFLRKWFVKALIVFGIAAFTEIMQAFGFYVLGVTFDLLDILMFAIGVLLAVFFDKQIFVRIIPYWAHTEE